jgi:hypothetical protein
VLRLQSTTKKAPHPQARRNFQVKIVLPHLGIPLHIENILLIDSLFTISAQATTMYYNFAYSLEKIKFTFESSSRIIESRTATNVKALSCIKEWLYDGDIKMVPDVKVSITSQLKFQYVFLLVSQKILVVELRETINQLRNLSHWYESPGRNFFCCLFKLLIEDVDPLLLKHRM